MSSASKLSDILEFNDSNQCSGCLPVVVVVPSCAVANFCALLFSLCLYSHIYTDPATLADPAAAADPPAEAGGDPAADRHSSPAAVPAPPVPAPPHSHPSPASPTAATAASTISDPTAAASSASATAGSSSKPAAGTDPCGAAYVAVPATACAAPAGQSLPASYQVACSDSVKISRRPHQTTSAWACQDVSNAAASTTHSSAGGGYSAAGLRPSPGTGFGSDCCGGADVPGNASCGPACFPSPCCFPIVIIIFSSSILTGSSPSHHRGEFGTSSRHSPHGEEPSLLSSCGSDASSILHAVCPVASK